MAYSTLKAQMERESRRSKTEKIFRNALEDGLFLGKLCQMCVEWPVISIYRRFSKPKPKPAPDPEDRYTVKTIPLDVPKNISYNTLDTVLESIGIGIDKSFKKVHVEYSGLIYHLYLKSEALEGYPEGNLRGISSIKDLSYFNCNHVQDFWIEGDGSLYVAINVYSFPTLEKTELPVPVKDSPFEFGNNYMGGLIDLLFFDPTYGEQVQIYLQQANSTLSRHIFWKHPEIEDKSDIRAGNDVPYYAVVLQRPKHAPVTDYVIDKLQAKLCGRVIDV